MEVISEDARENELEVATEPVPSSDNLGRGQRMHKPSVLLKDFVTYSARCSHDPKLQVHLYIPYLDM